MRPNEHTRRAFFHFAAVATTALQNACEQGMSVPMDAGSDAMNPAGLPSLGGAPNTAQGQTIAAFVDTVVPGRHRDPTGAPGGIDVGVPGLFFDRALPAAPLIPALVLVLDGAATEVSNRRFAALDPDTREQALTVALRSVEVLEFAVQLVRLAYFSAPETAQHLGYPGANPGYVNDPHFSFRRPMSREATSDGNYR